MAFMTKEWKGREEIPVDGFHHVEFYVGNAKQAAYYYQNAFGFEPYAYSGPETGVKDKVSYVLKQNFIYFVLTTPLTSHHPASEWLRRHGDFVHDIALSVKDPTHSYNYYLKRGAQSAQPPQVIEGVNGSYQKASIHTYGDTIHSLVNNQDYKGRWAPDFSEPHSPKTITQNPGLLAIDHIVGNVKKDEMNKFSEFYQNVFGFMTFVEFDENDISTQYSALKSRVVRSKNWKVKMPLNEPAPGLKKSQIDEYLEFNEGQGVQHIALLTKDIIQTVRALKTNGVEFLPTPSAYYDNLKSRVGEFSEDINTLKEFNILVDRDEEGYLLQLFTKPLEDRPTFFMEIIQRKGSIGFGQGNFQALFEAIEREQAKRGNL